MSTAVRVLDYEGSFIYEHENRIDALRIFHAGGLHERERLVSLSGPRSEIIRDGSSITCFQSGLSPVLFANRNSARLLPLVADTQGRAFARFYALHLGAMDRVAGYPARIVEIAPRDQYRYGYHLWIEPTTHLLLRSAVVDGAQRTLEQFMFVALDAGARPKQSDLAPSMSAGVSAPPMEVALGHAPHWRVMDTPPGFHFVDARRPAQGSDQTEHQMYTDGVANVSVYIEPHANATSKVADRVAMRGVISMYTHPAVAWTVTVLGDVPRATVERIARSVRRAPASATKR